MGGNYVVLHVAAIPSPPARAHAGLGSKMKDDIRRVDELGQIASTEIDRHKFEARPLANVPEIRQLLATPVVVVEAVDADDRVSPIEQGLCEMRADEARAAGDKGTHRRGP